MRPTFPEVKLVKSTKISCNLIALTLTFEGLLHWHYDTLILCTLLHTSNWKEFSNFPLVCACIFGTSHVWLHGNYCYSQWQSKTTSAHLRPGQKIVTCIGSIVCYCCQPLNSRVDTDVLMEVAYSYNFLAVSDSSTCPDIGTSWCHAGIIEHFEIRGFKMTP